MAIGQIVLLICKKLSLVRHLASSLSFCKPKQNWLSARDVGRKLTTIFRKVFRRLFILSGLPVHGVSTATFSPSLVNIQPHAPSLTRPLPIQNYQAMQEI